MQRIDKEKLENDCLLYGIDLEKTTFWESQVETMQDVMDVFGGYCFENNLDEVDVEICCDEGVIVVLKTCDELKKELKFVKQKKEKQTDKNLIKQIKDNESKLKNLKEQANKKGLKYV